MKRKSFLSTLLLASVALLQPGFLAFSQEILPLSASTQRAHGFAVADVHSFVPDRTYAGIDGTVALAGEWQAKDGEFSGTIGEHGSAVLLLDGTQQDFLLTATFQCSAACTPGIILRASSAGDNMSGILYSFAENDMGAFSISMEGRKETMRLKLDASPSPYPASMMVFRAEYQGLGLFYSEQLGAKRTFLPYDVDGQWNHVELQAIGNSIHGRASGAGTAEASDASVESTGYGQVGLYVQGNPGTEIRFRNVGIKLMDHKEALPAEVIAPRFRKQKLNGTFYSEAVTATDVNQDGNMDVIAGPNIFLGPDFLTRQEMYVPHFYAANSYPDPLLSSAGDVTGDGYPDVLHTGEPGRPGFLYVNPGEETRRWDKHMVIPSVDNEIAFLDDIDGDGIPEYIYGDGGFVGYAKPGTDPTKMWTFQPVTEQGPWGAMYAHGLGTGDINGDGRKDIIQAYGWWEQPATLNDTPWTYHPEAFGRWGTQQGGPGGGRPWVYDVNGDGLNDVITSLEAHGFGLAWFEQKRDAAGNISFNQHTIMDDFNQANNGVSFAALHAVALADIDGDGLKDIVTGKRWWAHFGENPSDPDAFGPPVLYWFKLVRDGGTVRYIPELINNHTGVGTDMITADLNNDGLDDVMTSTRFGTTVFLSRR